MRQVGVLFTCSGQTESDKLAECLCESAIKNFPGLRIRTDMSDGDRDWEEDFYILRKSWCPAVLTENFFMDNLVTLYCPAQNAIGSV